MGERKSLVRILSVSEIWNKPGVAEVGAPLKVQETKVFEKDTIIEISSNSQCRKTPKGIRVENQFFPQLEAAKNPSCSTGILWKTKIEKKSKNW